MHLITQGLILASRPSHVGRETMSWAHGTVHCTGTVYSGGSRKFVREVLLYMSTRQFFKPLPILVGITMGMTKS